MSANELVISALDLRKSYRRGAEQVEALRGVTFQIAAGEFVAIMGPSGSGKTTLLNLLGCMDVPTSGELRIGGKAVAGLSEGELTRLRRDRIGFIFQHFGLLPTLTVAENVALPTLFSHRPSRERVKGLLHRVGLDHREHHRPHQLSGGEMQRVAVARAVINEPQILLADEPTGNLDSDTGRSILALFRNLQGDGLTIVMVTHNEALAAAADRQLTLRDGMLVEDSGSK